MWTRVIVLGSGLAVAAQIAVAAVYYDGSDVSDRAARIEERLDREVHEWLHPLVPRRARAGGFKPTRTIRTW